MKNKVFVLWMVVLLGLVAASTKGSSDVSKSEKQAEEIKKED